MSAAPLLLLIDFQYAIDHPKWGRRANPAAEKYAGCLLSHARDSGWPVLHIRHDSLDPQSPYHPSEPTHAFKMDVHPEGAELVLPKSTNDAFIGTALDETIKAMGAKVIIVAGVLMEHSVGLTAKHAAALGYDVTIASDGVSSVDAKDLRGKDWRGKDWRGKDWRAEDILAIALQNFKEDYGKVASTAEIIKKYN